MKTQPIFPLSLLTVLALAILNIGIALSVSSPYLALEIAISVGLTLIFIGMAVLVMIPLKHRLAHQVEEERRVAEALTAEQVRYSALFNQNNDAVFFINFHGRHVAANARACEMFGYSHAELITMSNRDLVAPDELADSQHVLARLLRGDSIPVYERTFRRRDGRVFSAEINVALVRKPDGTPLHIQSIVRDVADRKEAEQQAMELRLVREKVRLLAELGRITSHDIRTPLSVISVNLHLLTKENDPAGRHERVGRIEHQVARLNGMIDDLQMMSRLESGLELVIESIDLNGLMETVAEKQRTAAQAKNQRLHLHLTQPSPTVQGDGHYLNACIAALVENAIHYTPEGGTITLQTEQSAEGICVHVVDTGIGIAPEDLPHIFDHFYKANKARTANDTRAGLGLPIALKIASLHGGTIHCDSTPGSGSRFTVELPLRLPTPQTAA
ncbi:MAG: PAS domain-containing sensor histidine kinase [bacterium]|nr:PAS domain-containing sensor histidine kinase [bacterium]